MKLDIEHDGDMSVGIPGELLTLDYPNLEDQHEEDRRLILEAINEFFMRLLDFPVTVRESIPVTLENIRSR